MAKEMILGYLKLKALSLIQDKLLFKPFLKNIEMMIDPDEYGLAAEEKFVTAQDGVKIQLWQNLDVKTNSILLIFHGNTGHFGDVGAPKKGEEYDRRYRVKLLKKLEDKGINYLAISPRGYGKSDGKASEEGFIKDVTAVLDYVEKVLKIPAENISAFGESMGASLAFFAGEIMAERNTPISKVISVAAFQNIEKKVMELHPDLTKHNVAKHLRHNMDNSACITKQHKDTHIYLIHPKNDETTPSHHSQFLEKIAKDAGMKVSYHELANVGHITWDIDNILEIVT